MRHKSCGRDFSSDVCSYDLAGSGTTDVQVAFTNTGTVSVQAGTLEFDNTLSGSGTINVSAGKSFVLNAGATTTANTANRSEERRVGKECSAGTGRTHENTKL